MESFQALVFLIYLSYLASLGIRVLKFYVTFERIELGEIGHLKSKLIT